MASVSAGVELLSLLQANNESETAPIQRHSLIRIGCEAAAAIAPSEAGSYGFTGCPADASLSNPSM